MKQWIRLFRPAFAAAAIAAAGMATANETLTPADSFDPGLGGLVAIAYDPSTDRLFVIPSFGDIHPLTRTGAAAGTPYAAPGAASNDIDIDLAPVDINVGGTPVAKHSLLVINGEVSPDFMTAVSPTDGTELATVQLPIEVAQTVGASYHVARNSLFVVDWSSDKIVETRSSDGAFLNSFSVNPVGAPPYDVFFGDVEVRQDTGNLLIVSSASGGRMREMTPTGQFVRDIDLATINVSFSGIAYNDATDEFWVSTTTGEIFHFDPLNTQEAVTQPPAAAAGDSFGSAVAIDGNLMVVGLPGADAGGTDSGAVAIYRIEGGQPVFEEMLTVPPEFAAFGFGASVAVSGDTIVVGTAGPPAAKGGLAQALAAAILQRSAGGGPFGFRQALSGNDMSSGGDRFGASVAIDANAVVIGAPNDDEGEGAGAGSGAAYLFNRLNNSVDFGQPVKVKPPEPDPLARFGASVAVRNNKVAVGAPDAKPGGGMATGSASMYQAVQGAMNRLGTVTGSGSGAGARFGAAVAVDSDGTVAVTAPQESDPGQGPSGAAYLVNTTGNTLQQTHRIKPEVPDENGQFGAAVDIDGGQIVVGSPGADNSGERSGAVFRFLKSGGNVSQVSRTAALEGQTGLGASVAISADRILSGAPQTEANLGSALLQFDAGRVFISGFE